MLTRPSLRRVLSVLTIAIVLAAAWAGPAALACHAGTTSPQHAQAMRKTHVHGPDQAHPSLDPARLAPARLDPADAAHADHGDGTHAEAHGAVSGHHDGLADASPPDGPVCAHDCCLTGCIGLPGLPVMSIAWLLGPASVAHQATDLLRPGIFPPVATPPPRQA